MAVLSEIRWHIYFTMLISSLLNSNCISFKIVEVFWFEPDKFSLFEDETYWDLFHQIRFFLLPIND